MSFVPGPFNSQLHQLAALRHLSLCFPALHQTLNANYAFLHPQHLPSLVSFALVDMDEDYTAFLPVFRQCAHQIRFLYIDTCFPCGLGAMLVPECKNLAQLCVIEWEANIYPVLTTVTTRSLLSFTTTWYARDKGTCLTWEEDLQIMSKALLISSRKVQLYLIPDGGSLNDCQIMEKSRAVGIEWEILPEIDFVTQPGKDLICWEQLRLRLV